MSEPSLSSDKNPIEEPPQKKRKRTIKPLPTILLQLNPRNFKNHLRFRREVDDNEMGEHVVAYEAFFKRRSGNEAKNDENDDDDNDDDEIEEVVDLTTLIADQLRILCKNVGVRYAHSKSKFGCRKAIFVQASNVPDTQEENGEPFLTTEERDSSNIIRLVNVLFSPAFYKSLIKLDDGGLPKNFWTRVATSLNGNPDVDISPLVTILDPDDLHYGTVMSINLNFFDKTTGDAEKERFYSLVRVREVMKQKMSGVSNQNKNDAYPLVDVAMKLVPGTKTASLTEVGCYYFFQRCVEKGDDIDKALAATRGTTREKHVCDSTNTPIRVDGEVAMIPRVVTYATNPGVEVSSTVTNGSHTGDKDEEKAYKKAIIEISTLASSIANHMRETNRLTEQNQMISLAVQLNKTEFMETLLDQMWRRHCSRRQPKT